MFLKIYLPQLPNAEFIRYLKRSAALIAGIPDAPAAISDENAQLVGSIIDMESLFLNDPASQLTQQLMNLDALRDKRFSALAHCVQGAAGSPVSEEAAAGAFVERHIELYGGVQGVTRVSDNAETSKLENFTADCRQKPELVAALHTLRLEGRIDDLATINQEFESTHVARSGQTADNKLPFNMLRKRKEAKKHYDELVDMLTGAGKLARGAAPWAALAAHWNQEVQEFQNAIAARKGHASAAEAAGER